MLETLRSLSAQYIRFFILRHQAGEIPAAVTHNSLALVSTLSSVALLILCNLGTQVHLMLTQPSSRTKASSVKREWEIPVCFLKVLPRRDTLHSGHMSLVTTSGDLWM